MSSLRSLKRVDDRWFSYIREANHTDCDNLFVLAGFSSSCIVLKDVHQILSAYSAGQMRNFIDKVNIFSQTLFMQCNTIRIVFILFLLTRFEQNYGVFSSEVSLPRSCVLWRYQINLIEHLNEAFAASPDHIFNFVATTALRVSRIQYLEDNICSLNDFVQFFVKGASSLNHLSRIMINVNNVVTPIEFSINCKAILQLIALS